MEQPKRLGDYEVLDQLGSGGMGAVYRVRNVISDRIEAMKVLLPDLVGRQDLATRFLREIKVLAALDHPHIAALRTAQTVDNQLVMIMELVEGQSLAQRLAQGPIAAADALQVVRQVLDALDYAHRQDVIHRDIKPANMMITPQGVVKLMDFGIARSARDHKLTQAGATTGSLSYISPEQINGGTPDVRSDLYSLGVSLYEMVTGQLPFKADNDFAVMFAHLQKAPVPPIELQPTLAPEINALVLKAIAKEPGSRFQTASEFRDAVTSAVGARASVPAAAVAAAAAIPPVPPIPAIPAIAAMPNTPGTPDTAPMRGAHQPAAAGPRGAGPVPPPRRVQGGVSPILYIALGAFLVVAAVGGMAYYARMAEATPSEPSTTPLPAASATTPTPPPETPPAAPAAPAATDPAVPTSHAATAVESTPGATTPAATTTAVTPAASTAPAATTAPAPAAPASAEVKTPGATARVVGKRDPLPAAPAERSSVKSVRRDDGGRTGSSTPQPAVVARPDTANQEALDRLETELDELSARATAVNGTLDRLKAEQARAGYGLRGDMAARQQTLNTNLGRAEEAFDRKDLARAQRYKTLAQNDLEVLEKFIGR
jgi:eukaryotic-like serine/threonine-protein kinase